jgi:SAM-dependent methyltransferase
MSQNSKNPWDERYSQSEYYYGREPNDWLKLHSHSFPKDGNVLSLGEGEGRNAVYLAQLGLHVTAVDASRVGLEKLEKFAQEKGVHVTSVLADLKSYEWGEECWDGIISVWCHLPPELRKQVHSRAVRALKKGGIFLLEAYHPRQLIYRTGGPAQEELLMTLEDLRSELDGLDFSVAQEVERVIHEGQGHFGRSAVVQILAIKRGS